MPPPDDLVIAKQGSFFIGGREVHSDSLSLLPTYAPSGTVTVEQMYVRYQIPADAKPTSIALIHGRCLTGATWETTPDGRMGWDEHLLRKGYPVYVVDQAGRGRSATNIEAINAVKSGKVAFDGLPDIIGPGREDSWAVFRFGPEYPNAHPGVKFPVDACEELWKQMVPDWAPSMATPNPTVPALSALAKRVGGMVLIAHSQSGIYPFQAAAIDAQGIAAIVALEPGACPAATDNLAPYTKVPILVVWGDYVETSPRWAPRLEASRAFVAAVNKAGGRAEVVVLPEIGIDGNSHMLMHDTNSLEIADWLSGWIGRNVR